MKILDALNSFEEINGCTSMQFDRQFVSLMQQSFVRSQVLYIGEYSLHIEYDTVHL